MIEPLAGAALGVIAVLGTLWARPRVGRSGWLDRATAQRVIVHTLDQTSIEGVVREVSSDGVVLTAARLLDHDVDVGGDVWVPRGRVLMVQRVEA